MNLAYMYLYGTNGVQKDYSKAFEYYQMAAEQNNPIALNNLGSLYFNGIGTNPDVQKAVALFTKAAELGNDNAARAKKNKPDQDNIFLKILFLFFVCMCYLPLLVKIFISI